MTNYIISLGGSLIVTEKGINTPFLKKFRDFIIDSLGKDNRFFIITGGGRTARRYIEATEPILPAQDDDKDWLGIHATRLNAHFMRTVLRDVAYKEIIIHPEKDLDFKKKQVVIAGGYRPGCSTDAVAVMLAQKYGASKILNLSNVDYVCDKDPKKFPGAKKIKDISWNDFKALVGNKWDPGLNAPFDPIASRIASREKMEVAIISGRNLMEARKFFSGNKFKGTLIR